MHDIQGCGATAVVEGDGGKLGSENYIKNTECNIWITYTVIRWVMSLICSMTEFASQIAPYSNVLHWNSD